MLWVPKAEGGFKITVFEIKSKATTDNRCVFGGTKEIYTEREKTASP